MDKSQDTAAAPAALIDSKKNTTRSLEEMTAEPRSYEEWKKDRRARGLLPELPETLYANLLAEAAVAEVEIKEDKKTLEAKETKLHALREQISVYEAIIKQEEDFLHAIHEQKRPKFSSTPVGPPKRSLFSRKAPKIESQTSEARSLLSSTPKTPGPPAVKSTIASEQAVIDLILSEDEDKAAPPFPKNSARAGRFVEKTMKPKQTATAAATEKDTGVEKSGIMVIEACPLSLPDRQPNSKEIQDQIDRFDFLTSPVLSDSCREGFGNVLFAGNDPHPHLYFDKKVVPRCLKFRYEFEKVRFGGLLPSSVFLDANGYTLQITISRAFRCLLLTIPGSYLPCLEGMPRDVLPNLLSQGRWILPWILQGPDDREGGLPSQPRVRRRAGVRWKFGEYLCFESNMRTA